MISSGSGLNGSKRQGQEMDIDKIIKELTLEEKAGLCSGRDFWHTKEVERFGIPSVMMCDGPHGLRKQEGEGDHMGINQSVQAVCFPTACALASSFDKELLRKLGETLGEECQAEDVAMLLGPGLNMKRSPLCGRNFEYFSEDPYVAGKLAVSYIQGLQGKGVAACVKHFAANNQETCRMSGNSVVDERTFHEIYLPAFEMAVKEGKTRSIMCSYNQVNGTYSAENKELLTDILREKWGYDGFVVTDWGAVKNRVKGLEAGLDLEMPGGPGSKDKAIVEAVQDGRLAEADLDDAVRRILSFVKEYETHRKKTAVFDRKKDHNAAVEAAQECAVLLKNDNNILPLSCNQKVAVIGAFAQNPRYQGSGSSHINSFEESNVLSSLAGRKILFAKGYSLEHEENDDVLWQDAIKKAKEAEVAVIFAGLPDSYETEGTDRRSMALPDNQNRLIEAVADVQPNVVVVLHGGAPVETPWISKVQAVLNMYLAGEGVGEAEAAILYGDINPSGKLAETWPAKLSDNPSYLNFPGENGRVEYREGIYIGYRYYDKKEMEVNFPFGHGCSYTNFAYSDLNLEKDTMKDTETLTVRLTVENTGNRYGKEVVQLYVQDSESSIPRPVRELKGFEKVSLMPGEKKQVCFELDMRSFAYYEPRIHDWFVESGEFVIEVGTSSRDIRQKKSVFVEGTKKLPTIFTRETSIGELLKIEQGRAFMGKMLQGSSLTSNPEGLSAGMGEGSDRMVKNMMFEMPLSAAVSFGRMTEEQLEGLLVMLNAQN